MNLENKNFMKSAVHSKKTFALNYQNSIDDPIEFWGNMGLRLDWIKPYTQVKDVSFNKDDFRINWYSDGTLNACVNCVDRHLEKRGNQTAILFEADDPKNSKKITYNQLHEEICIFANVLKAQGVKKGDRVTIYMPMIPESVYAVLACARIGAIHSVVFGGFSPEALAGRLVDCDSRFVITADAGNRGGKIIPLKENVDKALEIDGTNVSSVIVVKSAGIKINFEEHRDVWYDEEAQKQVPSAPAEEMKAEDPLFILYTSGSTGKPKGILHTTAGYLTYVSMTHEMIFDYKDGDIYWCTADVGWVTGHSYIIYGPLANGATTLLFEGVPNYPDSSRFWQVCEKYNVNQLYTAPTAIRSLMSAGDEYAENNDKSSLRVLGSVGEPINPEAWKWYHNVIGDGRCPIVDTWWQTETGGVLISPLPGITDLKPGSATLPFFGITPQIVDNDGNVLEGECSGNLCIADSWPGQARSIYGDTDRFIETYFSTFEGKYFTGDGCKRDEDGYYWITGRVDDVINVSGHRLGTAEIESAFVAHKDVAEAAVIGFAHDIKGQGIYVYVTLNKNVNRSDELNQELRAWVRSEIGPIATPDYIQFTSSLPKTRSGKIMRRILRKIADNELDTIGDTSTLADPKVLDELIENRMK